jgi:hypothetical protein
MASGATVKLGVEGISQFKTNMTQAKQAVKTLDAQLTLTEKTFKQTGDAESYMTEKAELLKAKLEQQKTILANAEKALQDMQSRGIDRASKAYQDMYRQMVNAKAAIIDTENQMNGVADAGDAAADGVSEMNSQLSNIGKGISWQNITEGFDKITGGIEKAAKKVISFGKQVASTMLDAGSWADDLQTRATFYEMTPEELQRMEKTARLIDTPVDAIISARKRLKKEMAGRSEETMGAFAALGIDPDQAEDAEDLFWKTGEALMKMGDEYDKEAYAQKLFGRSWNELIPLFESGRKEYEELNKSWNVVSQESIDNLQSMDDEYQKLMANWETFKHEALAQFATPMKQALEIVGEQLEKIQEWLKSEEGQSFVENVLSAITDGMKWIVEHKEDVVEALKWIVVGWAGLKLTGGALHVLQLINGLKNFNLFGGNKNPGQPTGQPTTGGNGSTWTTGFMNGLTQATTKGAEFLASQGGLPSVALDMFLNQTNTGRALRDGTNVIEGLQADIEEKTRELEHNVETFSSNWDANSENANVLAKLGKNNILYWDKIHQQQLEAEKYNTGDNGGYVPEVSKSEPTDNWEFSDDWSIEEQMAWVKAHSAAEKMEEVADELSGNSEASRQSSSDMSAAAGTLKGMPGQVEEAILRGMASVKIYIDGQQAGNVLTPYVNSAMAGILAGLTK